MGRLIVLSFASGIRSCSSPTRSPSSTLSPTWHRASTPSPPAPWNPAGSPVGRRLRSAWGHPVSDLLLKIRTEASMKSYLETGCLNRYLVEVWHARLTAHAAMSLATFFIEIVNARTHDSNIPSLAHPDAARTRFFFT